MLILILLCISPSLGFRHFVSFTNDVYDSYCIIKDHDLLDYNEHYHLPILPKAVGYLPHKPVYAESIPALYGVENDALHARLVFGNRLELGWCDSHGSHILSGHAVTVEYGGGKTYQYAIQGNRVFFKFVYQNNNRHFTFNAKTSGKVYNSSRASREVCSTYCQSDLRCEAFRAESGTCDLLKNVEVQDGTGNTNIVRFNERPPINSTRSEKCHYSIEFPYKEKGSYFMNDVCSKSLDQKYITCNPLDHTSGRYIFEDTHTFIHRTSDYATYTADYTTFAVIPYQYRPKIWLDGESVVQCVNGAPETHVFNIFPGESTYKIEELGPPTGELKRLAVKYGIEPEHSVRRSMWKIESTYACESYGRLPVQASPNTSTSCDVRVCVGYGNFIPLRPTIEPYSMYAANVDGDQFAIIADECTTDKHIPLCYKDNRFLARQVHVGERTYCEYLSPDYNVAIDHTTDIKMFNPCNMISYSGPNHCLMVGKYGFIDHFNADIARDTFRETHKFYAHYQVKKPYLIDENEQPPRYLVDYGFAEELVDDSGSRIDYYIIDGILTTSSDHQLDSSIHLLDSKAVMDGFIHRNKYFTNTNSYLPAAAKVVWSEYNDSFWYSIGVGIGFAFAICASYHTLMLLRLAMSDSLPSKSRKRSFLVVTPSIKVGKLWKIIFTPIYFGVSVIFLLLWLLLSLLYTVHIPIYLLLRYTCMKTWRWKLWKPLYQLKSKLFRGDLITWKGVFMCLIWSLVVPTHATNSFTSSIRDSIDVSLNNPSGSKGTWTGSKEFYFPPNIGSVMRIDASSEGKHIFEIELTIHESSKTQETCDYLYSFCETYNEAFYTEDWDADLCKCVQWRSAYCLTHEKFWINCKNCCWGKCPDDCDRDWDYPWHLGAMQNGLNSLAVQNVGPSGSSWYQLCSSIPKSTKSTFEAYRCSRKPHHLDFDYVISKGSHIFDEGTISMSESKLAFENENLKVSLDLRDMYDGINGNIVVSRNRDTSQVGNAYFGIEGYTVPNHIGLKCFGNPTGTKLENSGVPTMVGDFPGASKGGCRFTHSGPIIPSNFAAEYQSLAQHTGCVHSLKASAATPKQGCKDTSVNGIPETHDECSGVHGNYQYWYKYEIPGPLSIESYNCPSEIRLSIETNLLADFDAEDHALKASHILKAASKGAWGTQGSEVCFTTDTIGEIHTTAVCEVFTLNPVVLITTSDTPICVPAVIPTPRSNRLCLGNGESITIDNTDLQPPAEYDPGSDNEQHISGGTQQRGDSLAWWEYLLIIAGAVLGLIILFGAIAFGCRLFLLSGRR